MTQPARRPESLKAAAFTALTLGSSGLAAAGMAFGAVYWWEPPLLVAAILGQHFAWRNARSEAAAWRRLAERAHKSDWVDELIADLQNGDAGAAS